MVLKENKTYKTFLYSGLLRSSLCSRNSKDLHLCTTPTWFRISCVVPLGLRGCSAVSCCLCIQKVTLMQLRVVMMLGFCFRVLWFFTSLFSCEEAAPKAQKEVCPLSVCLWKKLNFAFHLLKVNLFS